VAPQKSQAQSKQRGMMTKNHVQNQAGWWFQPTPLKNDGVKVSWGDEMPNMMGKSKKNPWFQTTKQQTVKPIKPGTDHPDGLCHHQYSIVYG